MRLSLYASTCAAVLFLAACPRAGGPSDTDPTPPPDETGLIQSALRMLTTVQGEVTQESVALVSRADFCALNQQFEDDVADHYDAQPAPPPDWDDQSAVVAYCEARVAWEEELAAIYSESYQPGSWSAGLTFDGEDGRVVRPGTYEFGSEGDAVVNGTTTLVVENAYADNLSIDFDCDAWADDTTAPLPASPGWDSVSAGLEWAQVSEGDATVEQTSDGLRVHVDGAPLVTPEGDDAGVLSVDVVLEDCVYEPASWGR